MSTTKKLIIVGGGGFSREVIWLAQGCAEQWDVIGILDDNPAMLGQSLCNVKVLGSISDCNNY